METDDPQPAARCQAGNGLGQGGLQGLQLIVDGNAQGLEGPGCWVDALAVPGAPHCCHKLVSGLQDFLLAGCHNPARKALHAVRAEGTSAADNQAANALKPYLRVFPQSVVCSTPCCQAAVTLHTGKVCRAA